MRRPVYLFLVASACARSPDAPAAADGAGAIVAPPAVHDGRITLAPEQVAGFAPEPVLAAGVTAELVVSARMVATLRRSEALDQPLVLFENPDIAALYSEYLRARASYERTSTQLTRLRELFGRNAVAGKDVVDAQADYRQAEASVRDTEARLRQDGFDPKLIASLSPGAMLAVADVPEPRIRAVAVGQTARFALSAFPADTFAGRVTAIGETVDPETRTIRVAIELPHASDRIKPGMFARASISEGTRRALTVPLTAVVSVDAKTWVFVKRGPATFERQQVTLGPDDGHIAQVVSGLAAGDSVATENVILLKGLAFGY
jgi:membrane fusion protein, heavy metal efflux system